MHTIGDKKISAINNWINKYIFPGGEIPTVSEITKCTEPYFTLEDFHNLDGKHYDKTLMAWFDNFNSTWPEIKSSYDKKFYRMWKFYLRGCAGMFRCNELRVWQFVLVKDNFPVDKYSCVRSIF